MIKFDLNTWNRKKQFDFFKDYEDPFFNINLNLDITHLHAFCKSNDLSVILSLYYYAMRTAQNITEFRLRLIEGEVFDVENMTIGSTILNEDKSFSFCYFPMTDSVQSYNSMGKDLIEQHHKRCPYFESDEDELAVIHGSVLPWISFTGIKHARKGDEKDKGIPKFVFGKYFKENDKVLIPFSIEVHHGLMDGYHVGHFVENLQNIISGI